jgi:F-type H+-transporting ATPase subunit b
MSFSWWTFALQVANFLILIWLLRHFLFKPVKAMVARRKEEVSRSLAEAEAEKQKTVQVRLELEQQRAQLDAERQKILDDQRVQLQAAHDKLVGEARAEVEKIHAAAAVRLDAERSSAADELFQKTAELAVSLAERLLRGLAGPSIERAFLDQLTEYLDGLAPRERAALSTDSNGIVVKTAHPLDEQQQREWTEQLRKRIGDDLKVSFATEPALIAGAEISFMQAVLRFNWRDSLSSAAREMHRREIPRREIPPNEHAH